MPGPTPQTVPDMAMPPAETTSLPWTLKKVLRFTLVAAGSVIATGALAILGRGILGLLGMAAYVGPSENQEIGIRLIRFSIPPLLLAVALFTVAWLLRRKATTTSEAPSQG
ncbi:MAG: hypothetical protein VX768_08100 [Planctomycetota bacterium]|nr:hypothetical protein [Planctomycetota bacterium]